VPILAVSDEEDPRIADFRNVPDATLLEARGLFVAEGRIVVNRLVASSRFRTRSVMVTEAALGAMPALARQGDDLPVYVVPQALMNGVAGFNIHRGCLAIGERGEAVAPATLARQARRLVVLERVANADNIGGIFRNAAAFGVEGVIVDPVSTDPLYRKAIRTSVGTALQVPFARAQAWPGTLEELRDAGFVLLALTPAADAQPIDQAAADLAATKIALLLGHEGDGLSADAIRHCDVRARIPMAPGVDSLNVATAAAIALYEIARCSTS
jgi:tRNA G18 (ribose-2'-O)-methylase SpoU